MIQTDAQLPALFFHGNNNLVLPFLTPYSGCHKRRYRVPDLQNWAKRSGKTPEEWYSENMGGMVKGGEGELNQLPPRKQVQIRFDRAETQFKQFTSAEELSVPDYELNQLALDITQVSAKTPNVKLWNAAYEYLQAKIPWILPITTTITSSPIIIITLIKALFIRTQKARLTG